MEPPDWNGPYHRVISRGFHIASEHGRRCDPMHLLAALSELDDPIGEALVPIGGDDLLARPPDAPNVTGGRASYLTMQTQQAAGQFAASRDEAPSPAHLLVAIIDQADGHAMALLSSGGIDPVELRRVALDQLGEPGDLARIEIPPLIPAGYMDRPILDESDLAPDAWRTLVWRQAHLPLDSLRTSRDWRCLCDLEADTARRLYRRLQLHPDQELSLAQHHLRRVQELAHDARPDLVPPVPPERRHDRPPVGGFVTPGRRRRHWQPRFLSFTIGWGTWFGNRWSGVKRRRDRIQTRLFAFRTRAAYKDTSRARPPDG